MNASKILALMLVVVVLSLAALACTTAQSESTPVSITAPTATGVVASPTHTAASTAASLPTDTVAPPTPTSAPAPAVAAPVPPTGTPEPSNTPLPTFTPRPRPTPTNTPVPTIVKPTPTPRPTNTPAPPNPIAGLERADLLGPAQANQLKALPWIADGIEDSERDAAQMLIDAARVYPDTFTALLQKPWVTDSDITAAETNAIHGIRWAAKHAPALSEQMLGLPWVQDDITEAEGEAIYRLYRTGREDPELAGTMLDMPFMQTIEPDDALALSAISYMGRRGEDHLEALKQSQIFKDGITDDLTTLVRAAGTIRDADALAQWLVPGYASIEVHTSRTELTPELKISIFRDHGDPQPETMPEMVRIAEQLESLMQVPLPNPRLVYVISDQAPSISTNGISQGKRYDFAYGLRGDRENSQRFASQYATDRPMLPSVIIHELGHDYFGNELKSWLNHTPVKNFEYVYRLDGRDPSDVPETVLNTIHLRRGCEARNIQHLEEMNPPSSDRANSLCHHYLGYWMGRELLEAVGQEEYFARMRRFYYRKEELVAAGIDPGIAEIRELFPDQLEIVEHYWSGDVGNPEEQYWGGLANLIGDPTEHYFGCCCAGCMPVDA